MNIRPSLRLLTGSSRKTRIVSASALFLVVCAFGAAGVAPITPDTSDIHVRAIAEELMLPSLHQQVAALELQDNLYVAEEKMRSGDTIAALMTRLGINDSAASSFIRSDSTASAMLRLKPGSIVQAQTDSQGDLQWLRATPSSGKDAPNLVVTRKGEAFDAIEETAVLETRIEMHSGIIRSSLFAATDDAEIPDAVSSQIVEMFGTNINFSSDLKRGDRFNVAYETFWQNGQFVRAGRILAGEFVNAGKTFQAVWFDDPKSAQGGSYYGFDGSSMKQAFLKSPLAFTRISSGFSMRTHPILGAWKMHSGVDFAAPTGTPIHAASDGVIDFVGVQSGYGNVVIIKHANNISTVYAHMSRFEKGFHRGSRVDQGDVVGFVGMTGWATGPHLHYEYRVANKPLDPLTVVAPTMQALAGPKLQRFRAVASDMSHRFTLLQADAAETPAKITNLAAKSSSIS
ncbi:M23 family metallopeptidase [Glaciimonas immobilis]|uniref:Murein DD-endopeptidase MepM/ murein hydrolase activator NlpD n=1 Tax=Glaciimonas immobilis TaxID=728004 RepID=A0A840RQW1_9BURK|nr:M23 family metallopeptidase [Glaciimonas immobilis]MBB5200093.1 murein DD-endopeptidase MepM/ murein hydrolase activator NlpD [Glaciimonas immobilis]